MSIVESKRAGWTVEQFARLLEVSAKFVYKQVKQGALPAYRVGSMIRLDPKAAASWLRSRTTAVQHG